MEKIRQVKSTQRLYGLTADTSPSNILVKIYIYKIICAAHNKILIDTFLKFKPVTTCHKRRRSS